MRISNQDGSLMRIKILYFSFLFVVISVVAIGSSASQNATSTAIAQINNVINKAQSTVALSKPTIISRKDWKAKNPVGEGKEHTIRFLTIHHTGTPQKKETKIEKKMQNLQNFSQTESRLASGKLKPIWFDVPYHYYIAVDGKIAEGREIKFVGDTNTNYDPTGHALIVLEGNFETEQPSAEQQKSLREMTGWLLAQYKIPVAEIKAHNDYAATACPGNNLKILLPKLRAEF